MRHLANYNRSTISHTTAGADFVATTCAVLFPAGSGPGTVSTPSCDITINNDNIVEQNEIFSLSATILNSNGQDAQFTTGGDSASATIIDNNCMLVVCYRLNRTACHSYIPIVCNLECIATASATIIDDHMWLYILQLELFFQLQ